MQILKLYWILYKLILTYIFEKLVIQRTTLPYLVIPLGILHLYSLRAQVPSEIRYFYNKYWI